MLNQHVYRLLTRRCPASWTAFVFVAGVAGGLIIGISHQRWFYFAFCDGLWLSLHLGAARQPWGERASHFALSYFFTTIFNPLVCICVGLRYLVGAAKTTWHLFRGWKFIVRFTQIERFLLFDFKFAGFDCNHQLTIMIIRYIKPLHFPIPRFL